MIRGDVELGENRGEVMIDGSGRAMQALGAPGIRFVALDAEAAAESTLLPGEPHGDPADRFLVATARTQGVVLATRDAHIIDYGKTGFVRVLQL